MKTNLVTFIRWLISNVYALFSNPRQVRLVLTAILITLLICSLLVPSLASLADGAGVGH